MHKQWSEASCEFSFKTFVEVTFANSESDFRTQRYPNVTEAIKDQQRKLVRDLTGRVGSSNMDEVLEALTL